MVLKSWVWYNLGGDTGKNLIEYIKQAKNLVMTYVEINNFLQKLKVEILNLE